MYYLLTESFKEQQKELVKKILEAVPADKIYLLGSTLTTRRTETVFMTEAPSCRYVSHYYVLVLVKDKTSCRVVQDTIENSCRDFICVTAIVLYTREFNEWRLQGHRFAHTVCRMGVLLHGMDDKNKDLHETSAAEVTKATKESIYNEGFNKVTEFMAGADLYRIRNQHSLAAFMLHQAAEHALHAILVMHTGLRVNTHNLDKLMRYCTMALYHLPEIFPRNNEKNERLFQLLNKAYIQTRYKDDYLISTTDLLTITARVRALQDVIRDIKIQQ